MLNSQFCAAARVQDFMAIQAKRNGPLRGADRTPTAPTGPLPSSPARSEEQEPDLPSPRTIPTTVHCTDLHDREPTQVVSAATKASCLHLLRIARKHAPCIEFIEREVEQDPHLRRNQHALVGPAEADFATSPAIGLVTATLQSVLQRPLPRKDVHNLVEKKILQVATRYEQVKVLVHSTEESSPPATTITSRECNAITNLILFTTQHTSNATVTTVTNGSLGVVETIVQRISPDHRAVGMSLLAEDTLWELFLRQAGFSTAAAQAVLWTLSAPVNAQVQPTDSPVTAPSHAVGSSAGNESTLQNFISMSQEARETAFEGILGGRAVLARVSRLLDTPWCKGAD